MMHSKWFYHHLLYLFGLKGKTCGFLLPAFHRLLVHLKERRRGPPGILVLAPTRELACQIEEECVKFGRSSNIRSVCAYGGAPKSSQVRKIQGGIEVLIATPGRLNDLLEMKVVDLAQVVFLGKSYKRNELLLFVIVY